MFELGLGRAKTLPQDSRRSWLLGFWVFDAGSRYDVHHPRQIVGEHGGGHLDGNLPAGALRPSKLTILETMRHVGQDDAQLGALIRFRYRNPDRIETDPLEAGPIAESATSASRWPSQSMGMPDADAELIGPGILYQLRKIGGVTESQRSRKGSCPRNRL